MYDTNNEQLEKKKFFKEQDNLYIIFWLIGELIFFMGMTIAILYGINSAEHHEMTNSKMFGLTLLIAIPQTISLVFIYGIYNIKDIKSLSKKTIINLIASKIVFYIVLVLLILLPYFNDYKVDYKTCVLFSFLLYIVHILYMALSFLTTYFLSEKKPCFSKVLQLILIDIEFIVYGLVIGFLSSTNIIYITILCLSFFLFSNLLFFLSIIIKKTFDKAKNKIKEANTFDEKEICKIDDSERKNYISRYVYIVCFFAGIYLFFPTILCALLFDEDGIHFTIIPICFSILILIILIILNVFVFKEKYFGTTTTRVMKAFGQNNATLALFLILLLFVPMPLDLDLDKYDIHRALSLFLLVYIIDVVIHLILIRWRKYERFRKKIIIIIKHVVDFFSIFIYAIILLPIIFGHEENENMLVLITLLCILGVVILFIVFNHFVIRKALLKLEDRFGTSNTYFIMDWKYASDFVLITFIGYLTSSLFAAFFLITMENSF